MFKQITAILIITLVLAACSASPPNEAQVVTEASTEMPTLVDPTSEPTNVVSSAYNSPDWTNLPLVNARTGDTFTLADFAGKTVFIEPMATWCPNCRAQQGYVREAMGSLDSTRELLR